MKKSCFCRYFPYRTGIFLRAVLTLIVPALLFLHSCGIESYYYLPEVPAGNITTSTNQLASINLPSISVPYFTHFALYYRIYISYQQMADTGNLGDVNTTLNADYRYFTPYTDAGASTSINVASIMTNRNYQSLFFDTGSGISSDLLSTRNGGTLRIEFPLSGTSPYINYPTSGGSTGTARLIRSDGNGAYNPRPDRSFLDSDSLKDPANISTTVNADVVDASGSGSTRYAYASVYIVSVGLNEQTYTPIFSIPSFVGIFRLP
ncbi:MAG: hypothetical protein LBF63_11455 [Treponema sp.]|jgi:hypothetical protein|nr:hypothetical protein [Treponema sp.]